VLRAFLRLGVSSFGGPVAHLGYFRREFVLRRGWLTEPAFAELVALCQLLPGPASSQVGFAIGLTRAGYPGALAAWLGFTAPSALLMTAFAAAAPTLGGAPAAAVLHGLQLVAVAIVAQAVLGMARTLCPDVARACIAVLGAVVALAAGGALAQALVLLLGALLGLWLCRRVPAGAGAAALPGAVSRRAGSVALAAFLLMLIGLPLLAGGWQAGALALFAACYRSGALVFGGGHVVLPLLRAAFVPAGWVSDADFLTGYGTAQAMPGPLFSFAAYLGARASVAPGALLGALLGLCGIFLPGLLLLLAALAFWPQLRSRWVARAGILGINAAVVGLLAAALYRPVWLSAVHSAGDAAIAAGGLALLLLARAPPWLVVLLTVGAAVLAAPGA
jgi:chromate transporter